MLASLRRLTRSAQLLLCLALTAALLAPASAIAGHRHAPHARAHTHRVIDSKRCNLKRRKHSSKHSKRRCGKAHHGKRTHKAHRGRHQHRRHRREATTQRNAPARPTSSPPSPLEALLPPGPIGFAASEAPAGATGQVEETTGESTTTTETTTETASTETTSTESGEPESTPTPLAAQGEDFAGRPSDVLLTYPEAVEPQVAERCVAVSSNGSQEAFGNVETGATPQTLRLYLVPGGEMPAEVDCPSSSPSGDASAQTAQSTALSVAAAQPTSGGVLSDPIDPKYLTEMPFGARSFWIQPWRAYLDTWPASRLIDSLGINFNVTSKQAEDTAQLLQESGFKLARIEIGWNSLSYADPSKFANEADINARLEALHKHGLRPLILLNSNSGQPTPAKTFDLETTEEAAKGATSVKLAQASAEKVVPGKTGFNKLGGGYAAPNVLITAVSSEGVATLSKPLPAALSAGSHGATTLLYAPFGPPELANGERNPVFQETLDGWLSYVATVCKKAASIFGPEGYDLEVWNELTFGSQFLHGAEIYYSPVRETGKGSVEETLLDETVAYVRDPANDIPEGVGIGDGFANTTIPSTGEGKPKGLTALDKHPYQGGTYFPEAEGDLGGKPLNALGEAYTPGFQPRFWAQLPEYYLTATQPQTLTRELAPITTVSGGTSYGRNTGPEGATPLQTWTTEYNISKSGFLVEKPEYPGVHYQGMLTPAQEEHLQAEVDLRSLTAMISKGVGREYFYAATGAGWNMISEAFMKEANAKPTSYPGSSLGGETMASFRRLTAQMEGPGPEGGARQISLLSIAQEGNDYQFKGNGTAQYPDLYNRDMLAVLPFQSSPTKLRDPRLRDEREPHDDRETKRTRRSLYRFDLPPENFRITLGNLPETKSPPSVSAYDPIRGEQTPAKLISRKGSEAVFEITATDYPRLLSIEYSD